MREDRSRSALRPVRRHVLLAGVHRDGARGEDRRCRGTPDRRQRLLLVVDLVGGDERVGGDGRNPRARSSSQMASSSFFRVLSCLDITIATTLSPWLTASGAASGAFQVLTNCVPLLLLVVVVQPTEAGEHHGGDQDAV